MNDMPFESPYGRHTPVSNLAFDRIMPALSANGWKVLCVAIRQTWGWADDDSPTGRRQSDQISYSQFKEKTGIKSNTTISRAISECLDNGYLLRHQVGVSPGMKQPIYEYSLNVNYRLPGPKNEPIEKVGPEIGPTPSSEIEPGVGSEIEHTKEKERKKQNSRSRGADHNWDKTAR